MARLRLAVPLCFSVLEIKWSLGLVVSRWSRAGNSVVFGLGRFPSDSLGSGRKPTTAGLWSSVRNVCIVLRYCTVLCRIILLRDWGLCVIAL